MGGWVACESKASDRVVFRCGYEKGSSGWSKGIGEWLGLRRCKATSSTFGTDVGARSTMQVPEPGPNGTAQRRNLDVSSQAGAKALAAVAWCTAEEPKGAEVRQ